MGARLNSTPVPSVNAADSDSTRGLKSASSGTGSHDVPSRYGIPLRSQKPSSKPSGSPETGQHQAFGQHLAGDAERTRAKGQPQADFTLARHRTRQQQVRQIRAGDEQHQTRQRP